MSWTDKIITDIKRKNQIMNMIESAAKNCAKQLNDALLEDEELKKQYVASYQKGNLITVNKKQIQISYEDVINRINSDGISANEALDKDIFDTISKIVLEQFEL